MLRILFGEKDKKEGPFTLFEQLYLIQNGVNAHSEREKRNKSSAENDCREINEKVLTGK